MSVAVVAALAVLIPPFQAGAPYANWREAAPCVAVFDAAANRAYSANQRESGGSHAEAFQTWDSASSDLISSMNDRLSLAQNDQVDRIRRETDETLRPLDDPAVYARAEECKARLPDPIRLP